MNASQKSEALRLADKYEAHGFLGDHRFAQEHWCRQAAAELRSQHARIAELEAVLSAMGEKGNPVKPADIPRATDQDTHFFLAGWNGRAAQVDPHEHFRNAAATAPAYPAEGVPAQTTRDAVIQHLTNAGVLEHDGCGIFIASGDASELIDACMAISTHAHHEKGAAAQAVALLATATGLPELTEEALAEKIRSHGAYGGLAAHLIPFIAQHAAPRAQADALDAARYRWLRSHDLETISQGGVFAGMTPENVILNGEDLDEAIDAAIAAQAKKGGM